MGYSGLELEESQIVASDESLVTGNAEPIVVPFRIVAVRIS